MIDQIFCKHPGTSQNSNSGIFVTKISDHLPCFSFIDILKPKNKHSKFVKIRTNTEEALINFKNDLTESLLNAKFENEITQDPNISYNKLESIIQSSREKFLPVKIVKFKKYKHKISPWMTNGILSSMREKDKLYKKLKKTSHQAHDYPLLENKSKLYCSMTQKCIRLAKSSCYHTQFEKYKCDIKKTWSQINELVHKKDKKSEFPKYFLDNGKMITNSLTISECFNNFFVNVGPNLSKKINQPDGRSFKDYLTKNILSSFNFALVTEEQVLKIIKKLKPKSSHGHDGISTVLLKFIASELLCQLTIIINQSLCTGIFPDKLKIANIKPIYKKDDPHVPDNYRPISLLPSISKVFEK